MKWSASSSTTLLSRLLVALLQCSFLVSASASSAAHQQSPRNLQSQSFYILLELTFDTSPSKIAWKLDNARTRTTLADAPFGAYDDSMANMTIRVPLEFMTEKDLKSDPWVEGQTRDYKFTVFDRVSVLICLFRLVLCIYLRLESTSVWYFHCLYSLPKTFCKLTHHKPLCFSLNMMYITSLTHNTGRRWTMLW